MPNSQTRSQAVRQSLDLRIDPSPYTSSKVLLTAHTPYSAAMRVGADVDQSNVPSGNEDTIIFSVLCLYDFEAEEPGLLSFRKGEILDIIKRDDTGWWAGMRHDPTTEVGWIPQAYVTPLSEEMTERLRNLGEEFRIPEHEAEQLYNSVPLVSSLIVFDPDDAIPSDAEDDQDGRTLASTSSSSTPYHNSREVIQSNGKRDENVNPYTTGSPRLRPNPPPSPTSPMPQPPSRSGSFSKSSRSTPPPLPSDENRNRSGSLSSNRSLRRRPVILNDNTTLSRLSTLIESSNSKEIDKIASPDISGSFQALSKRAREERSQRRTMSEGTNHHHPQHHYTTSHGGKTWYLLPQHKAQLDEDGKGHIRFGTLVALVERLTTDIATTDLTKLAECRTFTNAFLMTFRTFTTADRLFEMLTDRFHLKPPKQLAEAERKDWKVHLRLPVQRRVLEVLGIWLEEHRLLEEEPHISKRMTDFLSCVNGPQLQGRAEAIIQTIERLTFNPNKLATTLSPKKARKSKAHKNDLLKLDPADIAEQLTLLEFALYVKVTPQECLSYAKTQSGDSIAGLQEFCATHDRLGAWVKTSILNTELLSKRADTVDFWIKVAEKCRLLSNFASMSAIIISLSSTVITRLHLTWTHVGRKSNLDSLLRFNEPTGGFAGYRALLSQAEGPCVPFITMFLTDIIHVQEQFSNKQVDGQICFYQCARWYEIVNNILRFQSRPYSIAPGDSTTNFIETHLREANTQDQNWYWTKSQEVQHSELAHADIRKGLEAAGF